MKKILLLAFCNLVVLLTAFTQVPKLCKDVNTTSTSSSPKNFYSYNGLLYMAATDALTGTELFVSNGTPNGTFLLKDIVPGIGSSDPTNFIGVGNFVYFIANDTTPSYSLWKTNGTPNGTVRVKWLPQGTFNSFRGIAYNNSLIFTYGRYDMGNELWISDGTDNGTYLVKDILTSGLSSSNPNDFISYNNQIFFTATDSAHGYEVWKTDGTSNGTQLVKDINPGKNNSQASLKIVFNNKLFLTAASPNFGVEIWITDGTDSGTTLFKDVFQGPQSGLFSAVPIPWVVCNNKLYFSASDSVSGQEPFISDGTPNGTYLIKDLAPGNSSSSPTNFFTNGKRVFFLATSGLGFNGIELHISDGTSSGTRELADLYFGSSSSNIQYMSAIGDTIFFKARSGNSSNYNNYELHYAPSPNYYPGILKDIYPNLLYRDGSNPSNLTYFNNKIFFSANDSINGSELWCTEGTANKTYLFKDLSILNGSSNISGIGAGKNFVVFNANDNSYYGNQLWISNGDSAGTKLLSNIASFQNATPGNFFKGGDAVYFDALYTTSTSSKALFKTDGTESGTVRVYTDYPGTFKNQTWFKNKLFLTREGSLYPVIYSHTPAPPTSFQNAYTFITLMKAGLGDKADNLTVMGNNMYFSAWDGASTNDHGNEIWKTDGTLAGTVLLKDIEPGYQSSNPANFCVVDSFLFFTASSSTNPNQLWKSDGNAGGTVKITDIPATNLISFKGKLFFYTNSLPGSLRTSDGTLSGTKMVKSVTIGNSNFNGKQIVKAGEYLFFAASTSTNGLELWRSDGTDTGTVIVKDIRSGTAGSNVQNLTAAGKLVFFTADDGINGTELWKSDGTASGTVMVEIGNGSFSSNPSYLTMLGDTLFFAANHPQYGQELWMLYTQCIRPVMNSTVSCSNFPVQFNASAETFGKSISTYYWDFGNGDTSSLSNPSYKYATPGNYNVKLRLTNNDGCSHEINRLISIPGWPQPDFAVDNDTVCLGNPFLFTNTSKGDTASTNWLWKFSDNTTSNISNPIKQFGSAQSFTAKLIADINNICRDSVTKSLTVLPIPVTSPIVGKSSTNSLKDTFSVTSNPGSTYNWTIFSGTQISGGNSNTIVVQWANNPPFVGQVHVVETNSFSCSGALVVKPVSVQKPVGIPQLKSDTRILAFPNPASEQVILLSNGMPQLQVVVSIYNILGQKVAEDNWLTGAEKVIDTRSFKSGLYYLVISGDNRTKQSIPVIIKHD